MKTFNFFFLENGFIFLFFRKMRTPIVFFFFKNSQFNYDNLLIYEIFKIVDDCALC